GIRPASAPSDYRPEVCGLHLVGRSRHTRRNAGRTDSRPVRPRREGDVNPGSAERRSARRTPRRPRCACPRGRRPLIVGSRALTVGRCPLIVGKPPLIVGRRPPIVGKRPLIVGKPPLIVGRRPLIVGKPPLIVGKPPLIV